MKEGIAKQIEIAEKITTMVVRLSTHDLYEVYEQLADRLPGSDGAERFVQGFAAQAIIDECARRSVPAPWLVA